MSPDDANCVSWGRKLQTRTLFFPRENFSLSLISVQKDCLASLRLADNCLLPSESKKFSLGKKCSSSFVFLPWTKVWHQVGTIILSNYSLFVGFLILCGHLVFSYRHRMFASEPYLTFPFQFFFGTESFPFQFFFGLYFPRT